MVKPAFENIDVECWVHKQRLGNSPYALCLRHSSVNAGAPIRDALLELVGETFPAQRTVTFPTCSRKRAHRKMILQVDSPSEDLKVMHIGHDGEFVTIRMTHHGLLLFNDALDSWLKGNEDFGVGPQHSDIELGDLDRQSSELWFWGPVFAP